MWWKDFVGFVAQTCAICVQQKELHCFTASFSHRIENSLASSHSMRSLTLQKWASRTWQPWIGSRGGRLKNYLSDLWWCFWVHRSVLVVHSINPQRVWVFNCVAKVLYSARAYNVCWSGVQQMTDFFEKRHALLFCMHSVKRIKLQRDCIRQPTIPVTLKKIRINHRWGRLLAHCKPFFCKRSQLWQTVAVW